MTNNTNTISDENGQYEDWVELYNGTSATINLSGKFLTDDPANWNKFALPNLNIPSHGFLLLWLDDDTSQGNTHCNFKLSANEILSLYNVEDGEPRLHDEVATFPATSDFSWERIPDGGIQIDSTSNATPGYSNLASQIIILNSGERIRCFPNPAKDIIHFDTYYEHAELMDCYGKIIEKTGRSNSLNITSVESGSYLLKLEHTIVPIIIIH